MTNLFIDGYAIGNNLPPSPEKHAEKDVKENTQQLDSLGGAARLLNTSPLCPVLFLTDALLWGIIRLTGGNICSRRDLAISVREHTQRADFVGAAAKVDCNSIVLRVECNAFVHIDVDGVAGAVARAVGIVERAHPRVFGESGSGEERDENGLVAHGVGCGLKFCLENFRCVSDWYDSKN